MEFYPGDHLVIQVLDPTLEQDLGDRVKQSFADSFPNVSTTVLHAFTEGQPSVSIIATYRDCGLPAARTRPLSLRDMAG